MKNPKIIGLLCMWACENFAVAALEQALEYCDEIFVCVAPHSESLVKYKDKTSDIVNLYGNSVNILEYNNMSNHAEIKADILNKMLDESKIFKKDNWIWILDSDEFYNEESYKSIKEVINRNICDQITVGEKYFYINLQHYLIGEHNRLFKIKDFNLDKTRRFYPTQRWYGVKNIYKIPDIMFHYGTMLNPNMKIDFWKTEYNGKDQIDKIKWIDCIYRNYDLKNENYWTNENLKLFGIKSPWFSDSFIPDENNKLFKYEGKHPKFIESSLLIKVSDYRKLYGFR